MQILLFSRVVKVLLPRLVFVWRATVPVEHTLRKNLEVRTLLDVLDLVVEVLLVYIIRVSLCLVLFQHERLLLAIDHEPLELRK